MLEDPSASADWQLSEYELSYARKQRDSLQGLTAPRRPRAGSHRRRGAAPDHTAECAPDVTGDLFRRERRTARAIRWLAIVVLPVAAAVAVILSLLPGPGSASSGKPYLYTWPHGTPIGITLSGLQSYLFGPGDVTTMEHQMRAAKYDWHANTVRLQVIQDKLVGAGGHTFRPAYMGYVRRLVTFGLHLRLTVVLNDQTEVSTGYALSERLPTYATTVFWQRMTRIWKNNPHVAFDLFNEPRKCSWAQWQAAMQPLITQVRDAGARNQLWVDGIDWGSTLAGVPLLHDPLHDLVYTIHHPGSKASGTQPAPTTAQLDAVFGDLADQHIRVVDAEFANYTGSYDWLTPGPSVRRYLAYLAAHHVGMLAWSLVPGALNATPDYASVSREPQGDGALIRAWFTAQSRIRGGERHVLADHRGVAH